MGDRGSSAKKSGGSILSNADIPDKSAFELIPLPELKGSEKQIKWAKDIRNTLGRSALDHAIRKQAVKNSV